MNIETISRQDYASLSKELAYLLGVYLTDGSITKCNFNLQAIDRDFVKQTLDFWKKYIPSSTSCLRKRIDKNSWNRQDRYVIKIGVGKYAKWFKDQTNNKHHIPLCIWDVNEGLKKWFVAGVMDGDGFITMTKRPSPPSAKGRYQYRIGIGGVADGWIYEFRDLLGKLNVKCNAIEKFTTKNGRWFCRFTVNPKTFFDAGLFFTIKRKQDRCIIASTTAR